MSRGIPLLPPGPFGPVIGRNLLYLFIFAERQMEYAVKTQHFKVFTLTLNVSVNSKQHRAPALRNFKNMSTLCNTRYPHLN
jgi:hypothetical protein